LTFPSSPFLLLCDILHNDDTETALLNLNLLLSRVNGEDLAGLLPVDRSVLEIRDDLDDFVDGSDSLLGGISLTVEKAKKKEGSRSVGERKGKEKADASREKEGEGETNRRVMVPFLRAGRIKGGGSQELRD